MKNKTNPLDTLNQRLFSSTYQLQRIVILAAIILGIAVVSFGAYYYYDRYYTSQPTVSELSISQAEQAVRDDPQNVDKRLMLAETYMLNRRFADAITQALQVKSTKPDNLNADFVLGVAYANSGKPQQAVDPLEKFIESRKDEDMAGLDQQLQSALYYLGDSFLQLGDAQDAIQPLEITVNFVQTDADSIYKLGLAYAGVQRYDDAIAAFQRAAAFIPNFSEAYEAMATAYDAQGKTVEAGYARAMVTYSKKDYATAHSMLAKINQSAPEFAPAFIGLGLTCEAEKDLPCALSAYQTAVKLEPDDFSANQGAQRVQAGLQK